MRRFKSRPSLRDTGRRKVPSSAGPRTREVSKETTPVRGRLVQIRICGVHETIAEIADDGVLLGTTLVCKNEVSFAKPLGSVLENWIVRNTH